MSFVKDPRWRTFTIRAIYNNMAPFTNRRHQCHQYLLSSASELQVRYGALVQTM
jgi:hypothetical protein